VVILWHIEVGAIEAQTRNADFTETGFTVLTRLSLLFGIQQRTMVYQATTDLVSKIT
jgi:hypothetical protein